MSKYSSLLVIILIASLHFSAKAGIIQVNADDFIATQTESFEQFAFNQYHSGEQPAFNYTADIYGHREDADSQFFIAKNGRWEGWSQDEQIVDLQAIDGTQFLAIYNYDYVSINFFDDVSYFGGYFADVGRNIDDNLTFEFFDQFGLLIDSINIDSQTRNGEMTWAGFYSDVFIGRVTMSGYQNSMDGLRIGHQASTSVPEPTTLSILFLCLLMLCLFRKKFAN